MRSRAGAVVLVVLSVLMGACADDGESTVAEEPKPVSGDAGGTSTTTPIDVSTIPDNIDERYVNAVLAALDQVDAQATKIIVQNKQIVPAAADHLLAIYNTEELDEQVEVWLKTIKNGKLDEIKSEPGARKTTVTRLISASPRCVFAEVQQDFSASAVNPGPPTTAYVMLVPLDRSRNSRNLNPTPWMIHTEGSSSDSSDPGDLCAA